MYWDDDDDVGERDRETELSLFHMVQTTAVMGRGSNELQRFLA